MSDYDENKECNEPENIITSPVCNKEGKVIIDNEMNDSCNQKNH